MYKVVSANRHREKFYSAVVPLNIALEYKIEEWTRPFPTTPIYCFRTLVAAQFFISTVDVQYPVIMEVEHRKFIGEVRMLWHRLIESCVDYETYKQAMFEHGTTQSPFSGTVYASMVKPIKIIGFHNVRSHIVV